MEERPEGILAKMSGKGHGKGKAGDAETVLSRGKCKVERRKQLKGDLVRKTDKVKNEHHFENDRESTTKPGPNSGEQA